MPIFPVRDLASKGMLRDPSPYQLDLNAFSAGTGFRFHANKAQTAPIWRIVQDALNVEPMYCQGFEPSTGYDQVFVGDIDGGIWQYANQSYTNVTETSVGTITITNGGTGYTNTTPPTVTFSAAPSGGSTATGVAVVSPTGSVVSIVLTNPGQYNAQVSPPTITIAAPGTGTTATATCVFNYVSSVDTQDTNGCQLGDVVYFNRPDRSPRYFGLNSTAFCVIPNMECQWTCRALRQFGDRLIALNVNKPTTWYGPYTGLANSGGSFPNMFKWSELTLYGQPPTIWDAANPDSSAGENQLEDLTSPLVDGLGLRGNFIIYSETEVWAATPVDSTLIWAFTPLFSTGGLLAPNCVVEVDGIHYCFGPKDIYKHDGTTKVSIIDKRNRDFVYRNLNKKANEVCFAHYDPILNQVLFCYQTGDPSASFQGADRCNQAAVYDITDDTWAFIDLPNVSALTLANVDTVATYANEPSNITYANVGGSYYDQQNTYVKYTVGVSSSISGQLSYNIANHRLLAYDFMTNGALNIPYATDANTLPFLERTGIALDQLGSDLTTYKVLRRIFPLIVQYDPTLNMSVQIGYSNTPSGGYTWGNPIAFNPETQYKVDTIAGGRYLGIRFLVTQMADFDVAGFDCDVTNGGSR